MERLANPLLREVMLSGYYKIYKKSCPRESYQIYLDVDNLMMSLKNKNNVNMFYFTKFACPPTPRRMSNNSDPLILNKNYIPCDTNNRINGYKNQYLIENILLESNNFKQFVFYTKNLSECLGYKNYLDNVSKYNKSLFGFHIDYENAVDDGAFWIIKYKSYYYIVVEQNGKQPKSNISDIDSRYIIFKKLTLDQLKTFDNGSYWKLIKEYNIGID